MTAERILDKDLHRTAEIEMLRHLANRGYSVCLVATHAKNKYHGTEVNFPVYSIPLRDAPVVRPFFFAVILLLLFPILVIRRKPSFVITTPGAFTLAHFLWKIVLSRYLNAKIILDVRSTPVESRGPRGTLQVLTFNLSIMFAKKAFDGMTIVTNLMREEVCRRFQIDPAFVEVWTNGVAMELFDPAKYMTEAAQLRKAMGLEGKTVVLYHGLFSPCRGIIESVVGMKKFKHDSLVLFLLGDGPALHDIQQAIRQNGLHEEVIVHKSVKYSEVPKYIAMSDIGLVPLPNTSDWKNQNALNLLEYLAMCKPVIATDIPANRTILGTSRCAVYVPSANPTEFSNALAYVHDNRKMLKKWGRSGRLLVAREYDWSIIAKTLDKYLASLQRR